MKKTLAVKGLVLMALSITCSLMAGCGAGSDAPPAPSVSVSSTQNPLVAQYKVAMGCAGIAMVEFGPDTSYGRSTGWYPIPGDYSPTPILVAGMKASTTYHMRAQSQCAGNAATSGDLTFTTGPLPSLPFPKLTVTRPNPSLSSLESPGIEMITIPSVLGTPAFFTDRDANPIWYYDVGQENYPFYFKFLPNGNLVVDVVEPTDSLIREIDLAGNTIREMDIHTLEQKMAAAGYDFAPGDYHHDMIPLPNGHLIVLTDFGRRFTNLPGYPGTLRVIGDGLIDLDQNWNPVWAWNSFDHLDVNRHLNGLPDWTHGNALVYLPDDGNLLFSMRHQSWVIKIDYNNGAGTGNILWRLGNQGDFALTQEGVPSDEASAWFSYQHFPTLLSQSGPQTTLAIWDNGNDRILNTAGEECVPAGTGTPYPLCYSRAAIFQVDESAMVANLSWADQLPYFSIWGGSINQMANGNVEFDLNDPDLPPSPDVGSRVQEVTQTSSPQVIWQMDIAAPACGYRAYRYPSLYNGVTWPF
jgi:arylsulfate sulfotransferase